MALKAKFANTEKVLSSDLSLASHDTTTTDQKLLSKYSRTSVARTLMARLPRLFRTRS